MDSTKAKQWEDRFKGKKIDRWTVKLLIDNGKSAAVFLAEDDERSVALKLFDDELIKRYGDESQIARIERELTLVGKEHPNMVRILGGGVFEDNHFIVMEFLNGPSLANCLADVPEAKVPALVEQLVSACEFLEAHDLAHRDIKPANIVILGDYERLVLLDFGVLKPVGDSDGPTDFDGQRIFIGTLQYSSPEFLLREESNDKNGWRALALYQVGAVVHDLIMRRPIFGEFLNPYAALVNAVQFEHPSIASETAPSFLVDACRMALVKDPEKRLEVVNWDSFRAPPALSAAEEARKRVGQRALFAQIQSVGPPVDKSADEAELLDTVIEGLKIEFRRIRQGNATLIPPLEISRTALHSRELVVRMQASYMLNLAVGLVIDVKVKIIDADAQAIAIFVSAMPGQEISADAPETEVFRGPYSSGAVGDRIEAAVFISLDHAQQNIDSPVNLDQLGVM
ncbi:serine/threonine protein kinase [Rhizobium sp. PP-CC-3G-465]|uniref:serine/threonine protein kinase n=1 Tax=Rhizobium sp. PP-CC-3G-465 TaxID=2135648 RepID=UPI0010D43458|nr:serine/threonine protein kinase [Rhizobium sp. PP-CC-3G-465]